MTREEKLARIYEVIAEKYTTIEKCCPECKWDVFEKDEWTNGITYYTYYECDDCHKRIDFMDLWEQKVEHSRKVMIWDVLDWIEENISLDERMNKLDWWNPWYQDLVIIEREHKRKSIDDQSDECIDFILSLIK